MSFEINSLSNFTIDKLYQEEENKVLLVSKNLGRMELNVTDFINDPYIK